MSLYIHTDGHTDAYSHDFNCSTVHMTSTQETDPQSSHTTAIGMEVDKGSRLVKTGLVGGVVLGVILVMLVAIIVLLVTLWKSKRKSYSINKTYDVHHNPIYGGMKAMTTVFP